MDGCSTHDHVFYCRISRLDISMISLTISFLFLTMVFIVDLDLSLPVGDKLLGEMILDLLIGYWAWIGSLSDH